MSTCHVDMSTWQVDKIYMEGNYIHIYNRGFEKSKIFFNKNDYLRFVIGLYRYNNKNGAIRVADYENFFEKELPAQDKLVNILKWTLLPNHYHIFLQEVVSGGAVEFVKRIGNGYTKYINIKNQRSGYLFQNSAKIIPVVHERHFLYIPFYTDLNIIDMIDSDWKEKGIKNTKKVMEYMESYKWSSYQDCVGKKNFPEIINLNLFYETFQTNAEKYKKDIQCWLEESPKSNMSTWQVDGLRL